MYKKILKEFIETLPEENKNMKLFHFIEEREKKANTNYAICGGCERRKKLKHRNDPWYNYGYCPIWHTWRHNYDTCVFTEKLEALKVC